MCLWISELHLIFKLALDVLCLFKINGRFEQNQESLKIQFFYSNKTFAQITVQSEGFLISHKTPNLKFLLELPSAGEFDGSSFQI